LTDQDRNSTSISATNGEEMAEGRIVGYVPPPGSNERTRLLRLKVIAGHNLAKKDIFGASDPYLRIDLVNIIGEEVQDSVLTKTKKRTLNPRWEEEFVFRVKPNAHKLVLEVFDENRLTRDDFLGMVELPLGNLPRESENRNIPNKYYMLRPRSARSKVKGHLQLYHAYVKEQSGAADDSNEDEENDVTVEDVDTPTEAGGSGGGARGGNEVAPPAFVANISGEGGAGAAATGDDWEIVGSTEHPAPTVAAAERPAAVTGSGNAGLPPGWEERQDANGRTYYVNHVARSTQWNHPSGNEGGGGAGGEAALVGETGQSAGADPRQPGQRVHISQDDNLSRVSISDSVRGQEGILEAMRSVSVSQDGTGSTGGTGSAAANAGSGADDTTDSGSGSSRTAAATASSAAGGAVPRRTSVGGSSGATGGDAATRNVPNSGGLPSGWTMRVAPNGRVFFINHTDKKTTWVDPRSGRPSSLPNSGQGGGSLPNRPHVDDLGPLPEGWEGRVHTDGRIFFIDHNSRATQWDDPRMTDEKIAGPAIPYNRDYKRKYDYLKTQMKKPSNVPTKFEIKVRRQHVMEDSYRQIQFSSNKVDILKTKLWIEFDNEVGLDYGGLAREWFYLLSKDMFNPYYGLFEYSATDNYTLQINPHSGMCNEEHISYFKFIGRIAGMAVYHGKLLDGFFIRPFYKMMLGKLITLKDMESVDTEYYNSLLWIKENDPVELDLTFQVDEEQFGTTITRELRKDGAKIQVTNENKEEYIQAVIDWRFVARVKDQMGAFKGGFNELVPLNTIKIFDEGELELLMCGIGSIDVKDWKQNTVYKGDYHPNHIVIQWFWRVVLSFNNELRSRLLQFVTGTSRVPMNGFKELYGSNGPQLFTIEKWGNPNSYPRAHTCFNRLDLPPYESYQQLRERLIRAIEGSEGFAGVD